MSRISVSLYHFLLRAVPFAVLTTGLHAENYSPYADLDIPNRVFFGDTHLHTTLSADAGLFGNRLTPDDAYRFAKGETVDSGTGLRARLQRPLDFLVISDHSENLGLPVLIAERNLKLLETDYGKRIVALSEGDDPSEAYKFWSTNKRGNANPLAAYKDLDRSMWSRIISAAERHNIPGQFTAFIGYEWTAGPNGNNLHRNVIFRDGGDKAGRQLPFSSYDSGDPEDLWEWMADYEENTKGRILAIPHNGNLSNGMMFDVETLSGGPLTARYARNRSRWEPLYEVTQIKGDGETHPLLSPNDEFADYGTWDKGSFGPDPKTPDMLPREYAREALKRGLLLEQKTGENPFKFGMIGSTDSHTGLSTAAEDNSFGKITPVEPSANAARFDMMVTGYAQRPDTVDISIRHVKSLASGMAAVWATDNTRQSIFDAMMRKEVYATTGSRIVLRVFAGWNFVNGDQLRPDFALQGYQQGVPMGATIFAPKTQMSASPALVIQTSRDPDGANLDRIQIVKGWVDDNGQSRERVYDAACSDSRTIINNKCSKAVGSTVNVAKSTYSNSIGEAMLTAFWKDPQFNANESAFYYVRVLEIPTPRWTTKDAAFYDGVELPKGVPSAQQDRAYSSPIWYKANGFD